MKLSRYILPLLLVALAIPGSMQAEKFIFETVVRPSRTSGNLTAPLSAAARDSLTVKEANLFDNDVFRQRVIELVGPARFEYMKKISEYCYPIEYSKNAYNIAACKSGLSGITDYEIQYFPSNDNLCVLYRLNGVREVYMNKEQKVRWTDFDD